MSAGYTAAAALLAVAALALTTLALRRWDLPVVPAESRPWWRTWQRSALLAVVAFGLGTLGPLIGSAFNAAGVLFALSYVVLGLAYNILGIRVRTYRVEQLVLWAVWGLGADALGADRSHVAMSVLIGLAFCLTFGAVLTKLGVRHTWKWDEMWRRQA